MPKTPMHEYHRAPCRKYKVWRSRQIATMEPVAVPHAMNQAPNDEFRLRVNRANSRHAAAAFLWRQRVRHLASKFWLGQQ